ncbi:uncharacterized protein LOC110384855 [Bombyx mori]|uniref:GH18 domain-containing protein n=1 Tax=Bombyx mori TaxID=7091 RepID=A0A8R2LXZ1_BOMMO|nr:uncharacterized protein LOC110384855 [Bombyx mori]
MLALIYIIIKNAYAYGVCHRGADDRAAFVSLLKELRLAFEGEAKTSGQPRLLLTAAVPASFEAIAAGYDVPEISKYLTRAKPERAASHQTAVLSLLNDRKDFINVMTYDFQQLGPPEKRERGAGLWLANNPDLNPTEHMWNLLKRSVRSVNQPVSRVQ